jgi:FemAB-related protein (PEP-CTERM system-associated)
VTATLAATTRVDLAGDDPAERAAWDAYVAGHPQSGFFHRWEWRALLAAQWGHAPCYLIARRAGVVRGVLPLALVRSRLFGSRLASLPFCATAGPLVDDDAALAALDQAALEHARRLGAEHLEIRAERPWHPDWPSSGLYAGFRRPIVADDAANLSAIPRKQRAMVRKGLGHGLSATIEDADSLHPLYADNVHRHGTPAMPRSWFRALQQAFGADCDVLVVRDARGLPVSAVMSFWHRGTVLPYYAGDLVRARELAANDYKYWALMRHAASRGCTAFDFGRSKVGSGPWHFKRNWGFEPQPLAYEYQLIARRDVPSHNPDHPRYRLLVAAWRRLPRPVVDWLGPRLVRGLG